MRLHTHVLTRDLAKIFDNCSIIIISGRMKRERERSIKKGREQRKKGEFRIGRETKRERHKQQERENSLAPLHRHSPQSCRESLVLQFLEKRIPGVGSDAKLRVV